MRKTVVLIVALLALMVFGEETRPPVEILDPKDGEAVPEIIVVKVRAPANATNVWVIVHPHDQSDGYYVPKEPGKKDWGSMWRCEDVHIGRSGNIDVGKKFSLTAVINTNYVGSERLRVEPEGPDKNRSPTIDVVRK